jgi:hypothetical protein
MVRMFIVDAVMLMLTVASMSAPSSTWAQDPTMDIVKKMKEVFDRSGQHPQGDLAVNSEGETGSLSLARRANNSLTASDGYGVVAAGGSETTIISCGPKDQPS